MERVPGDTDLGVLERPVELALTLCVFLRAIQKSEESPTIAPSAPASMTSPSWSSPCAAIVEAALRVVSPGKIGMTASNHTKRKVSR